MDSPKCKLSKVNHLLSTLLVCAGGGAGVADYFGPQFIGWGIVLGSLLSVGLALSRHES